MCGEHIPTVIVASSALGSSPRVRGALIFGLLPCAFIGIIPACAGSTTASGSSSTTPRDHPRVCGEHHFPPLVHPPTEGSSPRVRGALIQRDRVIFSDGIIPACAGSTGTSTNSSSKEWDHPRVCGEHDIADLQKAMQEGSSPRVRGAPDWRLPEMVSSGIIPACAGSTPCA